MFKTSSLDPTASNTSCIINISFDDVRLIFLFRHVSQPLHRQGVRAYRKGLAPSEVQSNAFVFDRNAHLVRPVVFTATVRNMCGDITHPYDSMPAVRQCRLHCCCIQPAAICTNAC